MQNFCLKLLIAADILMGKAALKRTFLVPHFKSAAFQE